MSGEAIYVDDIAELRGTLHAALGLSERAHARIKSVDLSAVRAAHGVVAVLTARDIPGRNDCGPILHDDPILAADLVQYIGQPIFAVVAETMVAARRAVRLARIEYDELPAVLSPLAAAEQQSFVLPPIHRVRGEPVAALAAAPRRLKGTFSVGGQEQFYLEGQISYAVPKENRGMHVWCSTQHPTEMQHMVAHALNLQSNQVDVEVRRMGGGFGGKESQSALFACVAAIAARQLNRPVKLRLDRDDDMMITGKRHYFHYDYEVGFDDRGLICAARIEMVIACRVFGRFIGSGCGACALPCRQRLLPQRRRCASMAARTNTQSNTAFRGFGGPQGAIVIEYIVDNIARDVGQGSA